jgi:hypothetical protein
LFYAGRIREKRLRCLIVFVPNGHEGFKCAVALPQPITVLVGDDGLPAVGFGDAVDAAKAGDDRQLVFAGR